MDMEETKTVDKQVFGVDLKIIGGFALIVYLGTTRLTAIENDISNLKENAATIQTVRLEQSKNSTDMATLQVEVASIKNAQKEQAQKLDNISQAINSVSQQVQSVTQSLRGR
jgi:predicted  nucleic acid-binding Zn-ribbon protein